MKTPTLFTNCVHRSIGRSVSLFGLLLVACLAISPAVQAVVPAPDGGYVFENTAEGDDALFSRTTGRDNTAVGHFALYSDTTGNFNTATGASALFENTTGGYNTANGVDTLAVNTTGAYNTATGSYALFGNHTGSYNTATGVDTLRFNASGRHNTANGYATLYSNTGDRNTATGAYALYRNTSGPFNTAEGYGALNRNTTGQQNMAAGYGALYFNNADYNSGFGTFALFGNSSGSNNSGLGWGALASNTSGSNNTALGSGAGGNLTTGSNNIDVGNAGVAAESNTIHIGTTGTQTATYVAGIFGATVTEGVGVIVDNQGHLGTAVSSARFKDDIKPMDKASEAILVLRPVKFHYKNDEKHAEQFGLIAEEVQKANPRLVIRDSEGNPYSVRYDAVNAMLLNEFLKEHRKVQELEATIAKQQKDFQATAAHQQKQIEALTAGLQRVSAQLATASPSRGGLEASKFAIGRIRRGGTAPQVVDNP